MTDTTTNIAADRSLNFAFVQGCEWAEGLKAGDTFRGSYGEAKHRGMDEDHARFFSAGGQVGLVGKSIICNSDDTIHEIG